jgi:hypothetical protein
VKPADEMARRFTAVASLISLTLDAILIKAKPSKDGDAKSPV